MKLSQRVRNLFGVPTKDEPTDALVTLIMAALDDENLRRKITALVGLPDIHRTSLVRSAIDEMKFKGEPPEIRAAFSIMATKEGAAAVKRALTKGESEVDPKDVRPRS